MKKYFALPLFLALALVGCSEEKEVTVAEEAPAVLVNIAQVERADVPVYIHGVGSVSASETVYIQARTGGELLDVFVEEGDMLFSLDKKPLEMALKAAKAGLQSNTIQLEKAQDDLERITKLSKVGSVSTDQIEQVTAQVNLLQTAILVDKVNIENASLNLSYAEITAPISGRVGTINTDIGNLVAPGQPILTNIDSINSMEVSFQVPEKHLAALQKAQKEHEVIPVFITTVDGSKIEGALSFIGNISTQTGTVLLKAKFDNKEGKLWVGQFVDITVTVDVLENVFVVPEKAVALGPEGSVVYIVVNDEAMLKKVKVSVEEGGYSVIESGVKARDKVVVDGHVRLYDGAKISVLEEK